MDSYRETFETWNSIASLYEQKFMYLDIYNDTYDSFCKELTASNATILEIGCGPGNITKYLHSKRPDFIIDAIDVAPSMIELAQKNNPNANFKVMDCRQIHEISKKYEGIICGFCLPYLSDGDCLKLISDSYRLLTQNGILYLSFVEGDSAKSGFQVGSGGDRVYFYYHNLHNLTEALIKNGFKNLEVFKVNYMRGDQGTEVHTILQARKKQ